MRSCMVLKSHINRPVAFFDVFRECTSVLNSIHVDSRIHDDADRFNVRERFEHFERHV